MNYFIKILLTIPLLWFITFWFEFAFGIYLIPDWLIYDDINSYYGEGKAPSGYILASSYALFIFLGTPTMFFIGTLYTAFKRMWWWFTAYMGLAGLPILAFIIAGKFS